MPSQVKQAVPAAATMGAAVSGTKVIVMGAPEGAQTGLPKLRAIPPFFLAVHPLCWSPVRCRDGEWVMMPAWRQISIQAGVNGCSRKGGRMNWLPATNQAALAGWSVIPQDTPAAGHPGYLTSLPVAGGVRHLTVFDSLYEGLNIIECDRKAMAQWAEELVSNGVIRPPLAPALRQSRVRYHRDYVTAAAAGRTDPIQKERAEDFRKAIEVIDAWLERAEERNPQRGTGAVDLDAAGED